MQPQNTDYFGSERKQLIFLKVKIPVHRVTFTSQIGVLTLFSVPFRKNIFSAKTVFTQEPHRSFLTRCSDVGVFEKRNIRKQGS